MFGRVLLVALASLVARPASAEEAMYLLHKWEQPIGTEYVQGSATEIRTNFAFADRGRKVPLAATLTLGADGLPRHFQMWGWTSRFSQVDLEVTVAPPKATLRDGTTAEQVALPKLYFTASGYAPMAVKQALLLAWHKHGRPASIPLLPSGAVQISSRGHDDFTRAGRPIKLERLLLRGLKWGDEIAWIDEKQQLIAVITNDAEFSHFEVVRSGYDELLERFVARAGEEGMAALAQLAPKPLQEGRFAITGARLVDGVSAAPVDDAVILVENGKITAAGKVAVPPGTPTLDARGKTVLPGLWDMHAHFEQVEWGPIYLAAGVTTVRDSGNTLSFLQGLRGAKLAPRVLCAGFVDGKDGNALGKLQIGSPRDIAPTLAKVKAAGCTQVKIYSFIDPALVAPIAREAHRLGLGVAGHVPEGMRLPDAVKAGFDLVSHIGFVLGASLPLDADTWDNRRYFETLIAYDLEGPAARALFALLVSRRVVIDPTIALADLVTHGARSEPGAAKVTPELAAVLGAFGPGKGTPPEELALHEKLYQKQLAAIGALHRAGVTIVAGTDQSVPGHSLHRELELYVQAGMTPLEAIRSATSVPARVMKLDKELGTIAPGKRADLILVDGDPLARISDIRKVSIVVKDGVAYRTAELWPLAGFQP
jgi:imidazolonepropionase-like amidohydrolase